MLVESLDLLRALVSLASEIKKRGMRLEKRAQPVPSTLLFCLWGPKGKRSRCALAWFQGESWLLGTSSQRSMEKRLFSLWLAKTEAPPALRIGGPQYMMRCVEVR